MNNNTYFKSIKYKANRKVFVENTASAKRQVLSKWKRRRIFNHLPAPLITKFTKGTKLFSNYWHRKPTFPTNALQLCIAFHSTKEQPIVLITTNRIDSRWIDSNCPINSRCFLHLGKKAAENVEPVCEKIVAFSEMFVRLGFPASPARDLGVIGSAVTSGVTWTPANSTLRDTNRSFLFTHLPALSLSFSLSLSTLLRSFQVWMNAENVTRIEQRPCRCRSWLSTQRTSRTKAFVHSASNFNSEKLKLNLLA